MTANFWYTDQSTGKLVLHAYYYYYFYFIYLFIFFFLVLSIFCYHDYFLAYNSNLTRFWQSKFSVSINQKPLGPSTHPWFQLQLPKYPDLSELLHPWESFSSSIFGFYHLKFFRTSTIITADHPISINSSNTCLRHVPLTIPKDSLPCNRTHCKSFLFTL